MDVFASRYKIVRTLGSGGMGVVYLVEDTRQGGKLMALKTLRAVGDASAVEAFRSEFRNLRGVVHPHIPEMYDFGVTSQDVAPIYYFTCEFVDGKPLDQLCRSWRQPDHLRTILVALSRALAFLHSRELLHCDLKRENVLAAVSDDGKLINLKLVDFGLASKVRQPLASASDATQSISGTIDYLAPELLQGQEHNVQSDLYALGMMMYRLATGRMPFDGDDPLALVKTRTTQEAPPPLRFRPDLPVGLSDVISSLLRLRPEDRPRSARHVIALLNEREGTDFAYETPETRAAYIRSAASVTNTAARERLSALRGKLESTTPKSLIILAARGLGRARLLRDFAVELQMDGYLARLVESDADLDATDPVRALLIPNADLVTREWLYKVIENAISGGVWCVIGLNEPDAELESLLGACETLELSTMTREESAEMVRATFPENDFPQEFSAELYDWAVGFPSAMQGIFDELLESGELRIGLKGWELQPGHRSYQIQKSVTTYFESRLAVLAPYARNLLDGLSCCEDGLPEQGLAELLQAAGTEDSICTGLERAGWIRAQDARIILSTAALKAHLLFQMESKARIAWHRRLHRVWSSSQLSGHPDCPRELLDHDVHGLMWSASAEELHQIIRSALDQGLYNWSRRLVNDALMLEAPLLLRPALLDLRSQISYQEGDLEGSVQALQEWIHPDSEEVTAENLDAFARFAMMEEKLGRADHAEAILLRCKALLPAGPNRWASPVFGTLAWIHFKRGEADIAGALAEEGLVRVPAEAADGGYALLLNTVATLAFYKGDMDAAALAWQRCLEVNEKIRDRKGIANMYNNLGVLAAQSGERLRARALWHKCAEIAREINDVHRLAGIYNNLGIDSLESGALSDAEEFYLKSLSLFRKMRAPREQMATLSNLGELAFHRADFTRAQAFWTEAVSLGELTSDYESQIEPLVYHGKLLCYLDQPERASQLLQRALEISRETGAKKGEAQAQEGLAQWYILRGDTEQSLLALQEANRLLTEDVDPLALLHLHLTECAVAAERHDERGVTLSLEKARKVGDIKWDPFTSARTLVYGLLFAGEQLDVRERARTVRQLTPYPDFLWKFYWATGRRLAQTGSAKKALEEYGRAVAVLKAVTGRLGEPDRDQFLASPLVTRFKREATELKSAVKADDSINNNN